VQTAKAGITKVSWFFFSKKEPLACFPLPSGEEQRQNAENADDADDAKQCHAEAKAFLGCAAAVLGAGDASRYVGGIL
jgi:hypothetical protein